ncbi:glycosyltransferase [Flavobacterium sp. HNIBRBA15423]|uniref:glycosyltransferase n=1 Tax=Flavobacterium sp. HNIBRBA15423 TaxID=3458683 RepID=UPI004044AA3A
MIFFKKFFNKTVDFDFNTLKNSEKYNSKKKTIVFISGSIPTYDKDSGSNRLKEIIVAYVQLGYNCILCFETTENDDKYVRFFNEFNVILFSELNNPHKTSAFLKSVSKIDFVWFYGPNTLKKQLKNIYKIIPESKTIYDMVDIHFLRYKRAIELDPKRVSLKRRYKKYFKIETIVAKKADVIIAISDQEKKVMSSYIDENKIIIISNIHYPKVNIKDTLHFEERKNILFIGSAHSPNIDALYFLYQKIMPQVWEKIPDLKVDIIGNLDTQISDIKHPNLIFHGYVPEIESYFNSTKFMIAPLRYGAGVKGKIGQSFEYYLPLITTTIGAEGMFLKHNTNALIANSAEDFATEIINLYQNKALWLQLQSNSEISLKPFSREILKQTLLSI